MVNSELISQNNILNNISFDDKWYKSLFNEYYYYVDRKRKSFQYTSNDVYGIINLSKINRKSKILDLACGYGRIAIPLAQLGYSVHGLDYSDELLDIAKKESERKDCKLTFEKADLFKYNFPDSMYDLITFIDTSFGYSINDDMNQLILNGIFKSLKPGGMFVIEQANFISGLNQSRLVEEYALSDEIFYKKKSFYDEKNLLWIGCYRYINNNNININYSFMIKIYCMNKIFEMLHIAGFQKNSIQIFGNWNGSIYKSEKSKKVIIISIK